MAQYRQSGYDSRFGGNSRSHSEHNINSNGNITDLHHHLASGIRTGGASTHHKQPRVKRFGGHKGGKKISIGTFAVVLCLVLAVTALVYVYLAADRVTSTGNFLDDDLKNDQDFLTNVSRIDKVKFGRGSVAQGRDSRYWDRDDRRRDEDYNEDVVDKSNMVNKDEEKEKVHARVGRNNTDKRSAHYNKDIHRPGVGLYNEAGRNELKMYEEKYEASLKNVGQTAKDGRTNSRGSDDGNMDTGDQEIDIDDEYDDGIDSHDSRVDNYEDAGHIEANSDLPESHSEDGRESYLDVNKSREMAEDAFSDSSQGTSVNSHNSDDINPKPKHVSTKSIPGKKPRKKPKHRNTCELKFLNSTSQLVEPLESRKFARFSLHYTKMEEKPNGAESWKPQFAGHQSLQEREDSFIARDQQINCGFVKGPQGYPSTGFDLAEDDVRYISKCHIAVVSCIFGSSDRLRSPTSKAVTRLSRKNVCFVMFMDERTLQTLTADGQLPDRMGFIGFWKIVIVKNLPYTDMRRVGKIPKLLPHRLFPSARYSIWLDSKLRLTRDPLLILEYFLWRKGHEFAISNHYDRHCIWEEVAQNKRLNKYNHTIIDQQFAFYQADGMKRFNASDPNKMLPSNVPEGSFIVRAHTPMSNLFSCLWFNEVDRFTPRDQLSFAYTYQKLRKKNRGKPFYLHMFKDCERRSLAKLYRHRSEDKHITALLETA